MFILSWILLYMEKTLTHVCFFKKSNPINLPLTAHPFHLIHHWIELKGKKNCIHKLSNLKAIKFLQFSSTSSPMLRRKNSSCLRPGSDDWWEVLFCFVFFLFLSLLTVLLGCLIFLFIYFGVELLCLYWSPIRGAAFVALSLFLLPFFFFVSFHPFLNEHFPI